VEFRQRPLDGVRYDPRREARNDEIVLSHLRPRLPDLAYTSFSISPGGINADNLQYQFLWHLILKRIRYVDMDW
jgi:hypothetical protein